MRGLQGFSSQMPSWGPSQVREQGTLCPLPAFPYLMRQQDLGPERSASPGLSAGALGLEPRHLVALAPGVQGQE